MSYTVTISDVRTRFTEFGNNSDYPDALIQDSIDVALLIMEAKKALPDSWAEKLALLISAHFVFLNSETANGDPTNKSPIASLGLGPTSTAYNMPSGETELTNFYNASSYGKQYNALMRTWQLQNRLVVNRSG